MQGIRKFYGEMEALRGVDLSVRPGEACVAIGPSGSGKTTLLRCINQLESISAGRVFLNGELQGYTERDDGFHPLAPHEIAAQRRRTGMVFQRFNLFPHMTAAQNVMEGPVQVKRVARRAARSQAEACSPTSASAGWRIATRASCRGGSSSAWRSRARWRWSPR